MTNEDCRSPSQTLHVLSSLHQSADLDLISDILGVFLAIEIPLLQYAPAASYHPPDCALQADILIVPQPLSFSEANSFSELVWGVSNMKYFSCLREGRVN